MKVRKYKIEFTEEQKEILNFKIANDEKRKKMMSVFSYILKYYNKATGFLEISLDKLYKKFQRCKQIMSLQYFKKIANELVEFGLLMVKRKGRVKYYGTGNATDIKTLEKENKVLKEENRDVKKELEKVKLEIEKLKEKINEAANIDVEKEPSNEIDNTELKIATEELVIETAYEMMNEVGIQKGSTPFLQVIESLYFKMDKTPIHIKGMVNYIRKVISNKVHNQMIFKANLIHKRKYIKPLKFNNFRGRNYTYEQMNDLEKRLLGWK